MDHYCEAFIAEPGRCWLMVYEGDESGHPTFCPEPPVWRARTPDRRGKWHVVDSCDGDVDNELVGLRRVISRP
jgi:hypothetical protein